MLNKTEGDSYLVMNLVSDSIEGYTKWTYPTDRKYDVRSKENNPSVSELITTCNAALLYKCSDETENCIILIGVYGNHEEAGKDSSY